MVAAVCAHVCHYLLTALIQTDDVHGSGQPSVVLVPRLMIVYRSLINCYNERERLGTPTQGFWWSF